MKRGPHDVDMIINEEGSLMIKRKNTYCVQFCIHARPEGEEYSRICGAWCPLFGEPEIFGEYHSPDGLADELRICGRTLHGRVKDRRKK